MPHPKNDSPPSHSMALELRVPKPSLVLFSTYEHFCYLEFIDVLEVESEVGLLSTLYKLPIVVTPSPVARIPITVV